MSPLAWCVVPAAGSGQRFGGPVAKQFVEVQGKSILMHSLEALACHPSVEGLVVPLSPDADIDLPARVLGKPVMRCEGGASRAASVLVGVRSLPALLDDATPVLVHDAARPNLRMEDISAVLEAARRHPWGALLATPVTDTLKQANAKSEVECTVPRTQFWRALTPQCFNKGLLTDALLRAMEDHVDITDESMAIERLGFHPALVAGRTDNLKITTQPDLEWFRTQLSLRANPA